MRSSSRIQVTDIDYNGNKINLAEYGVSETYTYKKGKRKGSREEKHKKFWFLTDLPLSKKNAGELVERGRMRWKIENEGFNNQKNQGYCLEHRYSQKYQGMKNHYYLIQIGHMIAQIMESWEKIWEKSRQSMEQKHKRMLESMKGTKIKAYEEDLKKRIQIRLTPI